MQSSESWQSLFENWPDSMPREGMLVTTFQETIPFVNFLISGGMVLVERDKPDTTGARKVLIPYQSIAALKIASPMELSRFQVMGFQAPL